MLPITFPEDTPALSRAGPYIPTLPVTFDIWRKGLGETVIAQLGYRKEIYWKKIYLEENLINNLNKLGVKQIQINIFCFFPLQGSVRFDQNRERMGTVLLKQNRQGIEKSIKLRGAVLHHPSDN